MSTIGAEHFCLWCFAKVPAGTHICPDCGVDMEVYSRTTPYVDRLLHALHHPLSETRMGAIIALGQNANPNTIPALVECAFDHPSDVIQALEILRSLHRMQGGKTWRAGLMRVATDHPAHAIRQQASVLLAQAALGEAKLKS